MSAMSDYFENQVIDHMLRNQSFTPPTTVYLALFTAATGLETNSPSAEVSGGSYAREAIALNAASGGASSNDGTVTFTQATGNWGTLTHVALMDAETEGNVLLWGALSASKTINSGDRFEISDEELDLSFD